MKRLPTSLLATHKFIKRLKCCEGRTIVTGSDTEMPHFQLLSGGGLITPSPTLANIFCKGFAVLDAPETVIQQHPKVPELWPIFSVKVLLC